MELNLRAYLSCQQDDWASKLSMAEFSANNHVSDTTQHSPFIPSLEFSPIMGEGIGERAEDLGESYTVLFA